MPEPDETQFPRYHSVPLARGDWVRIVDADDDIIAIVIERKETKQGIYVKLVPIQAGSGRPFWVPTHRCRRVTPGGDGGM